MRVCLNGSFIVFLPVLGGPEPFGRAQIGGNGDVGQVGSSCPGTPESCPVQIGIGRQAAYGFEGQDCCFSCQS